MKLRFNESMCSQDYRKKYCFFVTENNLISLVIQKIKCFSNSKIKNTRYLIISYVCTRKPELNIVCVTKFTRLSAWKIHLSWRYLHHYGGKWNISLFGRMQCSVQFYNGMIFLFILCWTLLQYYIIISLYKVIK